MYLENTRTTFFLIKINFTQQTLAQPMCGFVMGLFNTIITSVILVKWPRFTFNDEL